MAKTTTRSQNHVAVTFGALLLTTSCDIDFDFSTRQIVPAGDYRCDPDATPSIRDIAHLSNREYDHSIEDSLIYQEMNLGASFVDASRHVNSVLEPLRGEISLLRNPETGTQYKKGYRALDRSKGRRFAQASAQIGAAFADLSGGSQTNLSDLEPLFGSCVSDVGLPTSARSAAENSWRLTSSAQADCLYSFIDSFAPLVLRRPLNPGERDEFAGVYASGVGQSGTLSGLEATGGNPRSGLTLLFVSLWSSPDFLFLLEIAQSEAQANTPIVELSSVQMASKISYQFWESGPDPHLLQMGIDGTLGTEEGLMQGVEYALNHPERRDRRGKVAQVFGAEWLQTSRTPYYEVVSDAYYTHYVNNAHGRSLASLATLRSEARREIDQIFSYYTEENPGTVRDLLTTNRSFAEGPVLSSIYGVEPYIPGNEPPTLPQDRGGILSRPGYIGFNSAGPSPVLRGVHVLTEVMCETFGAVPADTTPPEPMVLPTHPTMRESFREATKAATCQGCHSKINPVGFALSNIDSLGRFITQEWAYNRTEVTPDHRLRPVDASSSIGLRGQRTSLDGPASLGRFVAESGLAEACITRHYIEFSNRQAPDLARDGCQLKAVRDGFVSGDLKNGFRALATTPAFRMRVTPRGSR